MKDKIKNASQFPKRFYGLHFTEGCAEYREADGNSFKIFVGSKAIRNMDATFEGKPVYVQHVDNVDLENIDKADGYVVKSFFNKADGKHWVEFMATTDAAHEALKMGWRLSNAYKIVKSGLGGKWHGMDYEQEVVEGDYDHLAIVQDPRYAESIILTPDEFKAYNEKKEVELIKLSNSNNKGAKKMFNFFKKEKVENSIDDMSVVLPNSKKEVEVSVLINEADEKEMSKDKPQFAKKAMLAKTENGEVEVGELIKSYNRNCKRNAEEDEENKKKEDEEEKKEDDKKK